MDKTQAHDIVRNTLGSSFDKNKFIYLAKNLLNNIDESKAFHARGYVPEIFKDYVRTYERIGTYTDLNKKKIDILIVYLQKETVIERARTSQRNFAARYLKDRDQKDAGLIAFVSPNGEDWRFSFVKMEYKFEETPKGTVKVKEEFTPAKRYSFLVGKNENSHTAQGRLVPLLIKDEQNPKLEEIEELFSVEKATKEFFEKYRDLYLRTHETLEAIVAKDKTLRDDFQNKNVNTFDFCKKLLGQIVFLYFLQRKGWFGVPLKKTWGDGDKRFLRSLFEHALSEKKNYFNDYLEPLFYEALAVERQDDCYSKFDCRIPFLNGGLFDPINNYDWVNTVINIPNGLFSNEAMTKEGDKGDGILDVFDRFNFTVKEDEPLEKEVAVDPEMLGKVFENLLEVKDRKSKGTYYTPREIVHYMCVQSLINYLATELDGKVSKEDLEQLIKYGESVGENEARVEKKGEETDTYYYKLSESIREYATHIDDKLADIKVCDPAIGSGAFPVGMMTEIVRTRNVLSAYISNPKRTLYNFKRHCIHNSLYGVDIDPGAIEIAKLRLWLSLIVDEDDIKKIKPLPNLDYKIMQGNSLLEEYEGIKLFDEGFIKPKMQQMSLLDEFSEAKQKATKLKALHELFFDTIHKREKDAIKKEIESLEWELIEATLKEQNKVSELRKLGDFKKSNIKSFFLWKLNFSEVFQKKGGFDVVIANPPYGANIDAEVDTYKNRYIEVIKNYADIYKIFYCLGLRILSIKGIETFISPNTFLSQPRYKDLRQYIIKHHLKQIINLGEDVFEDVVVPVCITMISNDAPSESFLYADATINNKYLGSVSDLKFTVVAARLMQLTSDLCFLPEIKLCEGMERVTDIMEIKDAGIQYHRSGIGLKNKGGNDLYERIVDSNPRRFKNTRPIWYGKLIDSYYINPNTDEYFNLDYKRVLNCNESVSFTKGAFEQKEKILWRQTAPHLLAVIDYNARWFRNTIQCGWIKDEYKSQFSLKYLLALFNSRYFKYIYRKIVNEAAGRVFPQVKITHIKKLPIKRADSLLQKRFEELVDNIMVVTSSCDYPSNHDKQSVVRDYEMRIDELVYKLYELSENDIRVM